MFRTLIYPSSGDCDYSVELLHLVGFIVRVRTTCYAVSPVVHISDINTLKAMHYVYFGGNSSNSGKIFSIQRKPSELLLVHTTGTSCRRLFKQVGIL